MLRIRADHAHHTFAVNHLALVAHLFNRRSNFHKILLSNSAGTRWPTGNHQRALLQKLYDPAARPVMRGKFHSHPIARTQSLKIPDARAGRVRNHHILVGQLQPVRRTRQQIHHRRVFADA
jgi:hypothetical protein